MDDIKTGFVLLFILVVCICVLSYSDIVTINNVKGGVFANITNTTTNKEIVDMIHKACHSVPWYYDSATCENRLLDTFIVPTK